MRVGQSRRREKSDREVGGQPHQEVDKQNSKKDLDHLGHCLENDRMKLNRGKCKGGVLEETLESPLDCKENKPIHSEGNQP